MEVNRWEALKVHCAVALCGWGRGEGGTGRQGDADEEAYQINTTIDRRIIVIRLKGALALTIVLTVAGCGKKEAADTSNTHTATDSATTGVTQGSTETLTPPPVPSPGSAPTEKGGMHSENIFARMALIDSVEIDAAKLALVKTKNAEIRKFANMMVADHGKMKSEGAALASRLVIAPVLMPDDPAPAQLGAMMKQLQSAPDDKSFDMIYADQMAISHQKALEFLRQAATTTGDDSLRAFIRKGEPVVQMHLDNARRMMTKLGAPVSQ
jgi:putative membrane protein